MGKSKPLLVHNCTTVTPVTACNRLGYVRTGGKEVGESKLKGDDGMLKPRGRVTLTISDNEIRKSPALTSNVYLQRQHKT